MGSASHRQVELYLSLLFPTGDFRYPLDTSREVTSGNHLPGRKDIFNLVKCRRMCTLCHLARHAPLTPRSASPCLVGFLLHQQNRTRRYQRDHGKSPENWRIRPQEVVHNTGTDGSDSACACNKKTQ